MTAPVDPVEALAQELLRACPKVHKRFAPEKSAQSCWATQRGEDEGRCHEDEFPDHWESDRRVTEAIPSLARAALVHARGLVPGTRHWEYYRSDWSNGWNACRAETLRRLGGDP